MEPLTTEYDPGGPRRSHGMPWWPVALVAAVLIAVLVWYFWSRGRDDAHGVAEIAEPAPPAPAPMPVEVEEAESDWELPTLSESDDFLRDVAARLSSHPEWVAWMATDDLVRRFVGSVDEVARGEMPSTQVGYLSPKRGFSTATRGGSSYLGGDSFRRFAPLAAVVSGIDASGAADLYRRLEPLFQEAYKELGYPNADFGHTLARAMAVVGSSPDQDRPPLLVPAVRSYKFADPKLENLPAAQKLMLRMGPENARLVKAKLREIAQELDRRGVTSGTGNG